MPPVLLGAIVAASLLPAWGLRRLLERRLVRPEASYILTRRQFFIEWGVFLAAGAGAGLFTWSAYGFPTGSSFKLMTGYLVTGFFIALDMALARERAVILTAMTQEGGHRLPARFFSMTRKFSLVACATAALAALTISLVIYKDIFWLATIGNDPVDIVDAQHAVMGEIGFIVLVLLGWVGNLIYSYTQNLRLLFENETRVLEQVSSGDLSGRVAVATSDEFGFIAGHTNRMIEGLRHRDRLLASLRVAEEVQRQLLPQHAPLHPSLDISGASIYCEETGGDYYDYFGRPDGRLIVVVADAADHGVGSALYMTTARALIRFAVDQYEQPEKIVAHVNRFLVADSEDSGRFMTLFYLQIDPGQNHLTWVRAGQEPALLYDPSRGTTQKLGGEGIALGILADAVFAVEHQTGWPAGGILVAATDGMRESRNPAGQMFGNRRIADAIAKHASESAEAIRDALLFAVEQFRGDSRQEDDVTLVVVKFP